MKRMFILLSILLVIALAGSLFVACEEEEPTTPTTPTTPTEPAEPVVLKMASASFGEYADVEQGFVDAFNARCGPDYTIQYLPAEQMVSFAEILDTARTGAADLVAMTPNAYSSYDPLLGVIELPFLFNNIEAHVAALPDLEPLYAEILEEQFNLKLLCLHNFSAVEMFSTVPVETLEDWDGLLVQSISPTVGALIEALGGAPVPIDYMEAAQSMQKGTVDAVITAPAAAVMFGLTPDVAPYLSVTYMVAALHGYTIHMDVWNSLPSDVQDIMLEEARKTSDEVDEWLITQYQADIDALEASGTEVYYVPQDEIDRWIEAASDLFVAQMAIYGELGEQVMAIVEAANALYPD